MVARRMGSAKTSKREGATTTKEEGENEGYWQIKENKEMEKRGKSSSYKG